MTREKILELEEQIERTKQRMRDACPEEEPRFQELQFVLGKLRRELAAEQERAALVEELAARMAEAFGLELGSNLKGRVAELEKAVAGLRTDVRELAFACDCRVIKQESAM